MSEPLVQWVAPATSWNDAAQLGGAAVAAFGRPSILRFAADDFMDELLAVLEGDPAALGARRAVWESWREPAPEPPPPGPSPALLGGRFRRPRVRPATAACTSAPAVAERLLKLYQPAHGRYYLVATSLVCRLPGLPDRVVDAGEQERVGFVMRRLVGPDGGEELALVTENGLTGWRRVAGDERAAAVLLPGEEILPLSPVSYRDDDGRQRRLWTGLIPAGKREHYAGAPELPAAGDATTPAAGEQPNPSLLLYQRLVSGPWLGLIDAAATTARALNPGGDDDVPSAGQRAQFVRRSRETIQTGSWYVILDFARFLQAQIPEVWAAIGQPGGGALTGAARDLHAHLAATTLDPALRAELIQAVSPNTDSAYDDGDLWGSLREALAGIEPSAKALEEIETEYDRTVPPSPSSGAPQWPGSLFPLADPLHPAATTEADVKALETLVAAALPATPAGPTPAVPVGARVPADPRGQSSYVVRCVFVRPRCAPLVPPLVGTRSEPFLLAAFFDPDAPARPIRIALPVDVSPAGLRKFDKNAVFMVSDALCGQINRLKSLSLGDLIRSVLPWPLHKDLSVGPASPCRDGGLCMGLAISISLPIITICALVMLLVIVALLDIIFHWLPYFIFVYPVRLFCAKGNS